jgi:hypothetical protein
MLVGAGRTNHKVQGKRVTWAALPLALLACVLGCHHHRAGQGEGEGTTAPPSAAPPRPLTHYTPPRSTWVLALRPHTLLHDPAWEGLMDVAFPAAQRAGFERLFVVRPDELQEAALVRWGDGGFVALLRGDFSARDVVRSLGMRMNTVEVTREEPARRVGFLGTVRREALELDPTSFAYSGDAGPAMAHVAADPPPDSSASVARQRLEALLAPAPVQYLHLTPVAPPPESPLYLVLSRQRALGVGLRFVGPNQLELEVALIGEFPNTIVDNTRALVEQLLRSDLGHTLLGRDQVPVTVDAGEQFVRARVSVRASTLHEGLRAVFVDGLAELLGDP